MESSAAQARSDSLSTMLPISPYLELASSLDRAEFITRHRGHFLLKRPSGSAQPKENDFGFATVAIQVNVDPFAAEWRIVPVAKRPSNPFPERLTVGRATNCDVVLRVPFVSKVHAHLLIKYDGTMALHDNRPSNYTFHNQKKLAPDATEKLEVGDSVGFGSLEFEFVDGGRLYDVLRREVKATAT
jgi:hypothetical protein